MFRRIHRIAWAALAAMSLSACELVTYPPGGGGAHPDPAPVSLLWQQKARTLVTERGMSPPAAARLLAATGMAAMRAVEAVEAENGNGGRSRYEARRGAVAGASARVLAWFVPATVAELEAMVAAQGEMGPGDVHPHFTRGTELGRAAADAVLAQVATDGFTTPWSAPVPSGPGIWTPAAMPPGGGTLGGVRPWFLTSGSQFRPAPHPAYLSAAYDADLAEVVAIGASLTQQQRDLATSWAFSGGSSMPVGYWNELAAQYVAAAGVDEVTAAKVFALSSAAMFDALIACFEAKYHYWLLRPNQADPTLAPVFTVPNYPAYPSGHGSVSASAARVLAHFFPQHAAELNAKVEEAAMSRLYAGIHYRFDMTAARQMAEAVADWVIANAE